MELFILFKPTVQDNHQKVAATANQTTTLTCTAQGYPLPQFTWYRQGALITANGKYDIGATLVSGVATATSSLVIGDIQASDFGSYTCVVMNSQGSATKMITLTVKRKWIIFYYRNKLFLPQDWMIGHIVDVLSICLSVVNVSFCYKFWTVRDEDLIIWMHAPLMMSFQMTPRSRCACDLDMTFMLKIATFGLWFRWGYSVSQAHLEPDWAKFWLKIASFLFSHKIVLSFVQYYRHVGHIVYVSSQCLSTKTLISDFSCVYCSILIKIDSLILDNFL